ncbi:MAG: UvrD-helicase domain-containing protein [Bacteroidetes bacterium]|nr:UvrD-helicase domain-containing protein [Bacteroidota bacterium]
MHSEEVLTHLTPHQSRALDIEHSISLRANAGSGKTFVLAKRYLQIAIKGNVSLQKIAAITFTDKAAGELYKRIAEEIEDKINSSENKTDKIKLEKIRRQLVSANISTIHSFCINILREFPVEAELDANFTPIDQTTAAELLELSVEETLRKKLEDSANEEVKELIRLFASKKNLVAQLHKLIDHRKIVLLLEQEIYKKNIDQIADFFREVFAEYFKIIFSPKTQNLNDDLIKINNEVINDDPDNEPGKRTSILINKLKNSFDPEELIQLVHSIDDTICTKGHTVKKSGYLRSYLRVDFEKEISRVENILNTFSKIKFNSNTRNIEHQLAKVGKYLINLFSDTIYLYDKKKKELGYIDYEDILLKTQEILKSDVVVNSLSDKFSYLMVDEYQDTNELQYKIFMPILNDLKRGNLFVVGDEKQSIYRFRDAELEVFNKTNLDIIEKYGDDYIISLPESFRMEPAICLFTNVLFKKLFKDPNKFYNEVEHSELICAKPVGMRGRVSLIIADGKSDINEAELIAKQILCLMNDDDDKTDWKDIAVLVKKRRSFVELEKQFTHFNIPNKIIGGRGFFQRQCIYDIYNYFSFLLDNSNDAALVGILRSPFFLISDSKIFEISLNHGYSFWDRLLLLHSDEELISVVEQLKSNLKIAAQRDFGFLLRKILEETNFIAVTASRKDSDQELANIEKLLKITNAFINQGFKTLYDYVNYLKDSINNLEVEAQAGMAVQLNAVSILTLHQSKGLEFPVVFLANCNEVSPNDFVKSKSITIDKTFGLLTKVPVNSNYFEEYESAPVLAVRDYIDDKKNLAEIKRLLYVGVTRAKKFLFISATSKGKDMFALSSFMNLVFDGLNLEPGSEKILLENKLKFLTKTENKYENVTKKLKLTVPIIREIELKDEFIDIPHSQLQQKKYLLKNISDHSKGEIISATKVAAYNQCAFKYNLIYKYGYSELYSDFRSFSRKEYYSRDLNEHLDKGDIQNYEDPSSLVLNKNADIKGKIIHKVLQKNIKVEQLEQFLFREIDSLYLSVFESEEAKKLFCEELIQIINDYYKSAEYNLINNFKEYKNEFEIYLNVGNYFLYGIIDKLIVTGSKIIIVDYKTDDIDKANIEERAKYYSNQLKFYIYIVSRLYTKINEFEIRIVFLIHPDNPYSVSFNRTEIIGIEQDITLIIEGILKEEYPKNLSHCNDCGFSINGSCVVKN